LFIVIYYLITQPKGVSDLIWRYQILSDGTSRMGISDSIWGCQILFRW